MKCLINKDGFTIIELITSFTLATLVMVFIFNVVILLKNNYIYNSTKSELIVNQSLLSTEINRDFENDQIQSITECGTNCYTITLSKNDTVSTKTLKIDTTGNIIKYGNYVYALESTETIKNFNICKKETAASGKMNSFLVIDIPIESSIISGTNFGVKIIYPYYNGATNIAIGNNC